MIGLQHACQVTCNLTLAAVYQVLLDSVLDQREHITY
jgi:hypothetical protein